MIISSIFIYVFLLTSLSIHCQSISSRVKDTKTNEGIPYATVQFSEHRGIITNEEGRFSINLNPALEQQDSIYISSMGYDKTAIPFKATLDSVIYIEPKAIELNEVYLFNNDLSIDEETLLTIQKVFVIFTENPMNTNCILRRPQNYTIKIMKVLWKLFQLN